MDVVVTDTAANILNTTGNASGTVPIIPRSSDAPLPNSGVGTSASGAAMQRSQDGGILPNTEGSGAHCPELTGEHEELTIEKLKEIALHLEQEKAALLLEQQEARRKEAEEREQRYQEHWKVLQLRTEIEALRGDKQQINTCQYTSY